MLNHVYRILTFAFIFIGSKAMAQWQTYTIGIDDNLTGIVIQDPLMVVSGHKGIYYSSNGISSSNWQKVTSLNSEHALSFSRTKFTHCFSDLSTGKNQAYACGYDTITREAALYHINTQNWSVKRLYKGKRNTVINQICYSKGFGKYLAVGNEGLILLFDLKGYQRIDCPYAYNFEFISEETDNYGTYLTILSKDYIIRDEFQQGKHKFFSNFSSDGNLKGIVGSYTSSYAVGNSYYYLNALNFYEYPNFNADTLYANCIYSNGYFNFIGTRNGIYRTVKKDLKSLEFQPSSSNTKINRISNYKTGLIAIGNHGRILFTENNGGATQLFTEIKSNGSCLNENAFINANLGSASSCKWYLDGVNVSNSCEYYSQTFKTVKAYEIKLIAQNDSGYSDTAIMQYNVVKYPSSKIKFSFSDTVLCKSGQIEVKLDSTELNTHYYLRAGFGSGTRLFGSKIGTGRSETFKTDKISETGIYLIDAKSTKATCNQTLALKLKVRVEKTTSKIYAHSINVPIKDTALFYEHCTDATNFKWSFSPQPLWFNDSSGRAKAIFNKEGEVKATLVCWSDKGCRDSSSSTFTNVYDPNSVEQDSCWNIRIRGIDKEYNTYQVNGLCPLLDGGFLIDGSSPARPIFESRKGKSVEISTPDKGYLAKYDHKGVLNWIIGKDYAPESTSTLSTSLAKIISEDSKGNILVASPKFLRDAGGKVLDTGGDLEFAKLNRYGELIYMITANKDRYWGYPINLYVDKKDNIYSIKTNYDDKPTQLYRNGDSLVLLKLNSLKDCNFTLSKFDSEGNLLWARPYIHRNLNFPITLYISFDSKSNLYISGSYEDNIISSDPDGNHFDTIYNRVNGSTGHGLGYIQKLDSNGNLKWSCRMYTIDTEKQPPTIDTKRTLIKASQTNSEGSTFIAGINNVWNNEKFIFENANGSILQAAIGDQYLMKVDANGIASWIVGTKPNNGYFGNVCEMSLTGDEIILLGNSANDRHTQVPAIFTSTNGDSIILDFKNFRSDKYLAHYDTNGAIRKIMVSGFTENVGYFDLFEMADFYKHNNEYFVLAKFIHISNRTDLYGFGQIIDRPFENRPGYLFRFTDDCLLTFLPNKTCKSLNLNIKQSISSCDSFIFHKANKYKKSGLYLVRDTFTRDCDTTYQTINLNLKVDSSFNKYSFIKACEQFVSPKGKVYDSTGLYSEIYKAINGCDSVIHYNVSISNYKNTFVEDTSCQFYRLGNNSIIRKTGYYLDTLVSKSGCDSFIYASIQVYEVESNIKLMDSTLVCMDSTGKYAWLDCSNYKPIAGATGMKFKPSKNGSYACVIFKNECYDTSDCINYKIESNSILQTKNPEIRVFPNPSKKSISIEINEPKGDYTLSLYTMNGQLITNKRVAGTKLFDLQLPEEEGVYNLHLQFEAGIKVFRIIKN